MGDHVVKSCKSAFYFLHNIIRSIRKYLTRANTETLIHAFITSKLDYCNSLLYGVSSVHLNRLQRVQNACARLVCNMYKYCHITPILIDLHWLPVKSSTVFKMLPLVFKTLQCNCPDYLSQLITVRTESRYSLRSSNQSNGILLQYPSIRSRTCLGDQAFLHAAPYLWNQLPVHVRNATNLNRFKALLKTHLFRIAFDLAVTCFYLYFNESLLPAFFCYCFYVLMYFQS